MIVIDIDGFMNTAVTYGGLLKVFFLYWIVRIFLLMTAGVISAVKNAPKEDKHD